MNKPLAIEGVMECADPLNELVPEGGTSGKHMTEAERIARMVKLYDDKSVASQALGHYRRASVDSSLSSARRKEHRKQVEELNAKCIRLDRAMTAAVLS